jgi:hypothetical protein
MIPTKPFKTEPYGYCVSDRFGSSVRRLRKLRTWSTLLAEERPIRRLQRLRSVRKEGSHPMHRVTEERTQRECGWKHSAKDTEL